MADNHSLKIGNHMTSFETFEELFTTHQINRDEMIYSLVWNSYQEKGGNEGNVIKVTNVLKNYVFPC
jgi:hypothetical protein